MTKNPAKRINIHPRHQATLGEVIAQRMRGNVFPYPCSFQVSAKVRFVLRYLQHPSTVLHRKYIFIGYNDFAGIWNVEGME